MAKVRISNEELIDALNGIDSTYDRLSRGGQEAIDKFWEIAEKGFKQKDLNALINDLQWDYDRMNSDGQYYFDIITKASL